MAINPIDPETFEAAYRIGYKVGANLTPDKQEEIHNRIVSIVKAVEHAVETKDLAPKHLALVRNICALSETLLNDYISVIEWGHFLTIQFEEECLKSMSMEALQEVRQIFSERIASNAANVPSAWNLPNTEEHA